MADGEKRKKKHKDKLPEPLQTQRTHIICGPEVNYHTNTATSASMYLPLGVDNGWDFDAFKDEFQVIINHMDQHSMEFEMIGIDPAIANAIRRILLAEVPAVAIEHVFIVNNTSIIQDEVFAHRLGLVPIQVDPSKLEWKSSDEAPSEKNTIVLKLDVTCTRAPDGTLVNDKVYSSQLLWLQGGSELPDETSCRFAIGQQDMFSTDEAPTPVHDDILLAKLRPGQSIELEAHCIKGIGKDHAKWSPVATAWYRLHPEVVLLQEVEGELAEQLASTAPGLVVVDSGADGVKRARVTDARQHENLLEKVRRLTEQELWAERIQVRKRKEHFIFTIESTGALPPQELFKQALDILAAKCDKLATRL
eukprot:jgi/Chrzof1/543/Cz01g19190.t1